MEIFADLFHHISNFNKGLKKFLIIIMNYHQYSYLQGFHQVPKINELSLKTHPLQISNAYHKQLILSQKYFVLNGHNYCYKRRECVYVRLYFCFFDILYILLKSFLVGVAKKKVIRG